MGEYAGVGTKAPFGLGGGVEGEGKTAGYLNEESYECMLFPIAHNVQLVKVSRKVSLLHACLPLFTTHSTVGEAHLPSTAEYFHQLSFFCSL